MYGIPAFKDSLIRPDESIVEGSRGFDRTLRKQVADALKEQHQPLKTLQQSVVQFARDARALAETLVQAHVELLCKLMKANL